MDLESVTRSLEGWSYFVPFFIHSNAQQTLTEKILPHATHSSENRADDTHMHVGAGSDFHAFFWTTPHLKPSCLWDQLANGLGFHTQLPGSGQEQEGLALSCRRAALGWVGGTVTGEGFVSETPGQVLARDYNAAPCSR